MPASQFGGRFFDQTYQSRYGDRGRGARRWNHGCWSEVWLTTRSMSTRMPRLSRLVHELDEVAERPVARVDAVVVGDVVAVVAVRASAGTAPSQTHVDAEALEVVEPAAQPLEVADAVAVGVQERLDVEAVDDRVLVPEVAQHAPGTLLDGAAQRRFAASRQAPGSSAAAR